MTPTRMYARVLLPALALFAACEDPALYDSNGEPAASPKAKVGVLRKEINNLPVGLVANYPLDNSTVETISGAVGSGSSIAAAADRFGRANMAYNFTASAGRIQYPANAAIPVGGNARTVSMWIKTSSFGQGGLFGYGTEATTQGYSHLIWPENRPYFRGHGADLQGSGSILDDRWHHYATTYAGGVLKIYIDGVLNASGNIALNTGTGYAVNIGTYPHASIGGIIDDGGEALQSTFFPQAPAATTGRTATNLYF